MATDTTKLEVVIQLTDKLSDPMRQATSNVKSQGTKLQNTAKSMESKVSGRLKGLQTSFSSFGKKAGIALAGVTAGIALFGAEVTGFFKQIGRAEDVARGFERNFGNVEDTLNTLRAASRGTISDFNLMLSANKAALLGITTDATVLAGLLETARLRGREMGLDTTAAFNDIVTGIGRGSPLILDNLGILIPDAFKKMSVNMDEAEKKAALVNLVLRDGAVIAADYTDDITSTGDQVAKAQAEFANLTQQIGEELAPAFLIIIDLVTKVLNVFKSLIKPIKDAVRALDDFIGVNKAANAAERETASGSRAREIDLQVTARLRAFKVANPNLAGQVNSIQDIGALQKRGVPVNSFATGGMVKAPIYAANGFFQSRGSDTVPAMLTPGEAVMSKQAVENFVKGKAGNSVVNIDLSNSVVTNNLIDRMVSEVERVTNRTTELNMLGLS